MMMMMMFDDDDVDCDEMTDDDDDDYDDGGDDDDDDFILYALVPYVDLHLHCCCILHKAASAIFSFTLMNKLNSVQVGPLGWRWARCAAQTIAGETSFPASYGTSADAARLHRGTFECLSHCCS